MDAGITITGLAAVGCFISGRGVWMRHLLLWAWLATAVATFCEASVSLTVLVLASVDLVVAVVALARFTQDPTKRAAQVVGGLSMAIMPAHFIMAASSGGADWTLYASACNAVFILQCLTVGGWLDGVGRCIASFWGWFMPVRSLRDRGR